MTKKRKGPTPRRRALPWGDQAHNAAHVTVKCLACGKVQQNGKGTLCTRCGGLEAVYV